MYKCTFPHDELMKFNDMELMRLLTSIESSKDFAKSSSSILHNKRRKFLESLLFIKIILKNGVFCLFRPHE